MRAWPRRFGRPAASLAVAIAILAAGWPLEAHAQVPARAGRLDFDWTVPPRLTAHQNPNGLIDYATPPNKVGGERWPVRLRATGRCDKFATYRWRVMGHVVAEGAGRCVHVQVFPSEGSYAVTLDRRTSGRWEHATHRVVVQNWLVVAIGDSVASGEGNPDVPRTVRSAKWQDPRCHRSAIAGVAQAARRLEEEDDKTSVTFVDLACSGATIPRGLIGDYAGVEPPPGAVDLPSQLSQLHSLAARAEIDAVVISVGANDVYFAPIARFCAFRTKCFRRPFDPSRLLTLRPRGAEAIGTVVDRALGRLGGEYDQLAASLPLQLPNNRVHIAEYFDPTKDSNGSYCRRVLLKGIPRFGIDQAEIRWAYESIVKPLNAEVHAAARRNGWRLVDGIAHDFRTHGYCAGRERWIITLSQSLLRQGGSAKGRMLGTLHPNRRGHEAIGDRIYASLYVALYPGGRPVPPMPPHGGPPSHGGGIDPELPLGGVGGAIALGAAATLFRGGRRRPPPGGRRPLPAGPAPDWLRPILVDLKRAEAWNETDAQASGLAMRALLAMSNEWIHRRVETVAFTDDTIRRRVSVDFTLPAWVPRMSPPGARAPGYYAPLAILAKTPLTSFDLRDEAGKALPLLSEGQNGALAAAALVASIEQSSETPVPASVRELASDIATGSRAEALAAIGRLTEHDSPIVRAAASHPTFEWLANTLAGGFIVLVRVAEPRERRIVKFSYEEPVEPLGAWRRLRRTNRARPLLHTLRDLLFATLGWRAFVALFEIPDPGGAASYHFELETARDLEVIEARFAAIDEHEVFEASVGPVPRRRVHMYLKAPPGSRGLAWGAIRAQRRGLLRGALVIGGFTTGVLTVASVTAQSIGNSPATAAPLLLAVPGALSAYLSRPDEHPLTSRLLLGARALVIAAGLCSFAGAAFAALSTSTDVLRTWLQVLAVLTADIFVLLLVTYLFPRPPRA